MATTVVDGIHRSHGPTCNNYANIYDSDVQECGQQHATGRCHATGQCRMSRAQPIRQPQLATQTTSTSYSK
ncbi:hypothetical protein Tco_0075223, partial [Tanacetum coccineum]